MLDTAGLPALGAGVRPFRTAALLAAMTIPALAQPELPVSQSAADALVVRKTVAELAADLAAGRATSAGLVAAYRARIAAIDRAGPALQAVLAQNPDALADAGARDAERAAGGAHGPLFGIPILVKDNIETADPMPTTAGSMALAGNLTHRDAPIVARLRAAGAVILGKANLSEWANMRSTQSVSGWSGMGGQTRNAYALDRSPCGSSSGSGVAVAASLAAAAIGTETDGSITCPAAVSGVVGFKPTLGLLPRTHIVPLAHSQDTAGPMTATVTDAALMLAVMAGSDPADPATAAADTHKQDYAAALSPDALRGKRVGVLRFLAGYHPELDAVFARALDTLRAAGAELVEIPDLPGRDAIDKAELTVLLTELKADLNSYLPGAAVPEGQRTLAGLIAFNHAHADRELALFGQEHFDSAEATHGLDDPAYLQARATSLRLAGAEGIDRLLAAEATGQALDVLVAPTNGPAWTMDAVNGDHYMGSASTLPAVAGYPHLSVPMGTVSGLPVGLSFIGAAWSDAQVLGYGHAFELRAGRPAAPTYPATLDTVLAAKGLLAPLAP